MSTSPDARDVQSFIQALFLPDDIVELRSIWPIKGVKSVRQDWCRAEEVWGSHKLTLLAGFNAEGFGIYVGVNPRRRHGGAKDADVLLARALFVDFDGGCTADEATTRIKQAGLPEPTIVVHSGHGVHCYWKLDRPLDDLKTFREHQAGLIQMLGSDTAVKDPPRVMRLPGFVNTKEPAAPAKLVTCVRDRVYGLDRFPIPPEPVRPAIALPNSLSSPYGQRALESEIAKVLAAREGERNTTLLKAAFRMGRLIPSGHLQEAPTSDALIRAGVTVGLPEAEALDVVTRGLAGGATCPRDVQPPSASTLRATVSAGGALAGPASSAPEGVPETGTPEPVPAFVPFPVDVLPEPVRSFVIEGAKAIGCDTSYVALPLIPAIAAAIGNTFRIRLKLGWEEPPIVWTGIVGESGTMKSPAFKLAMKATRAAQKEAFKAYKLDMEMWATNSLQYEVELAAWKQKAKQGKASEDPPKKPEVPVAVRYVVSDTTIEALAPILLNNPRGVLLNRDEMTGWLASFDRYAAKGKGGGDAAHWLSMFNGESMTSDRKTGNPPTIHVPSAAVSITGGIQPGRLADMMGREHRESGMLARIVFADPPRKAKRWTEAVLDPSTEAAMNAVMGRLFGLKMDCDEFDPTDVFPKVVELSPGGKAAFIKFYNEHAHEQVSLSGDEAAAWSKLEGYAARFALIVHLLRWAAGDPSVPDPMTPVDENSISAGVTLTRWFGAEALRVYATLAESDEEREVRQLADWISRHGGSVTVNRLTHNNRKYKGKPEKALADLNRAATAGYGAWELVQNPKGGPASDVFKLHQSVPVTKTPETHVGFEGSGDRDASGPPKIEDDGWRDL
jgi:hypothetical protein